MDEWSPRIRKLIAGTQLLFAALTALFGFYVKIRQDDITAQQQKIKEKQDELTAAQLAIKNAQEEQKLHSDTTGETEKFAKTTQEFLEKLTIDRTQQKEAILIDLLDAIALATVSASGKTDKGKLEHMPLSIALATRNVEALGLIGVADDRRDTWYQLARMSGDAGVQMTAMEALARSSARDPVGHLLRIFELSENLNNEKTLDSALEQVARVVRVMARDTDPTRFRESKELAPVVGRLAALSTSLGSAVPGSAEPAVANRADGERLAASALAQRAVYVKDALDLLKGSAPVPVVVATRGPAAATPTPPGEAAPPPPPAPAPASGNVQETIAGLKSSDTETRRYSRTALANVDDGTVTERLLDELKQDPTNYRLRIGVASVLYQAKQPVLIRDPDKARVLVNLLGDDDLLVRKYASESLMKLTDPESVQLIHGVLRDLVGKRSQPGVPDNGVYNAVVILGTWLRVLPSSLQAEKRIVVNELTNLRLQLQREPNWTNTARLIDELLRARDDAASQQPRADARPPGMAPVAG
jgi:hypothetical protein